METNILTGFLAGLGSFITPCVLPMVPVYLMYLTGSLDVDELKSNMKQTLVRSIAFVLGFTIVFMLLGMTATAIGKTLFKNKLLLQKIGGVLVVFFGLVMLGVFKLKIGGHKRFKDATGFFPAVLMGMAFSIGWTPCFGPVLGAILALAGSGETIGQGALLLFAYSMGLGIPFILSGIFAGTLTKYLTKIGRAMKYLPKVAGVIMIIFGILMFMNKLSFLFGL